MQPLYHILAVSQIAMAFNLSSPGRPIEAGMIIMGETEVLDVAPIDLLNGISTNFIQNLPLSDELKAKAPVVHFNWVTEKGSPARLTSNMTLQSTHSFATAPRLDIVIIGAYEMGYTPTEAELAFISKAHTECAAFLAICGGFMPAQLAGVLAGKMATAPRFMVSELQKQDPRTTWVERRWVRDEKTWTSGALLNGLDAMREFLHVYWPELTAIGISLGGWPVRENEYQGTEGFPVPMQGF